MAVMAVVLCPVLGYANVFVDATLECSKKEDSAERLRCFDAIATLVAKTQQNETNKTDDASEQKWSTKTEVSKIDDSKNVYVSLSSKDNAGMLFLRCVDKKTDAYIAIDKYIRFRETEITYRIGVNKAVTRRVETSTDGKAVFMPKPIQFIKDMEKSEAFLVRISPYSSIPLEIEFDISGLAGVDGELKNACGWE